MSRRMSFGPRSGRSVSDVLVRQLSILSPETGVRIPVAALHHRLSNAFQHHDRDLACRLLLVGEIPVVVRSEEHTSELQSHSDLVCRLLLEQKTIEIYSLPQCSTHAS